MNKALRIGIVGVGSMGGHHAKCIQDGKIPNAQLVAVCDFDERILSTWESVDGVEAFKCFEDLLEKVEVDAVIIATPHYSHTSYGIASLNAGLHTLVEKPISVHKADCERLIAASEGKGLVFSAMFNQRTNPAYVKLKQLIESGELGEIHRINWTVTDWYRTQSYYNSGGWRATWSGEGGGVLLNQCPHQIDLYQWLFGMPKKVRSLCQFGRFHEVEVEDAVTALFEHESGATGVFITTTGEAPGTNRLEVAADRGKIVIDESGFSWVRNEVATSQHLVEEQGKFTKPDVWNVSIPFSDEGEQHIGILKNFVAACLEGEELIAPASEGIRSVELANSVLMASVLDETITLPLCSKTYEAWLKEKIEASTFVKAEVSETVVEEDFSKSF